MKPHKIDFVKIQMQLELALKFLAEAKAAHGNPKAQQFVDAYLLDAQDATYRAGVALDAEHDKYHLAKTFALAD